MSKKYFINEDDERCYTLSSIRELVDEVTEVVVIEAEPEYDTEHFFCSHFDEVGMKDESCGTNCEGYSPRNGKSGRCRHSNNCYIPTDKTKTIKFKRNKP